MDTILITPRGYARYGDKYSKKLESLGYKLDINDTGKPVPKKVFEEKAKKATGIIFGVEDLNSDLLSQCKNLKAVVKFGVGLDNLDQNACEKLGIKVGRCVGTNSIAVAELTMGLVLDVERYITQTVVDVKSGSWNKPTGNELYGKTIGIMGFGHVGRNVARIANGFGMKVLIFDAYDVKESTLKEYDATQVSKDVIYNRSDIITVHVPLLSSTHNMISVQEFKKMKKDAILINASRGGTVDEKALLDALKNKTIKAAAFDVFTQEPPEMEGWKKELIQLDNFLLTSHMASRSAEAEIRTVSKATETMIELLK